MRESGRLKLSRHTFGSGGPSGLSQLFLGGRDERPEDRLAGDEDKAGSAQEESEHLRRRGSYWSGDTFSG